MKGALSWAPLSRAPARVLDLGTGTGIWANQFAEKHPEAEVIGIDLSLIQPPADRIPSNCKFIRKDADEPWNFGSASEVTMVDLIHLRNMATSFDDPKAIVGKVFQSLGPGGWVEYQEWAPSGLLGADDSMDERLRHSAMMRFQEIVAEGAARIGRDVKLVPVLRSGFVDVVERRILCPNNPWPSSPEDKLIGKYAQRSALDGMEAASVKICPIAGMTAEQPKELMGKARKEMMDETLRAYYPMDATAEV
ncbi:hypothetical protein PG991_011419 [Apiospora marii]|uniref:Methyltransferase domain-containing protein n=1 Tax=Apiospora marii TaxID=335849 RepID=A0ABR1RF71_9PEZI